jgi:small subunit ribosomal protein S13
MFSPQASIFQATVDVVDKSFPAKHLRTFNKELSVPRLLGVDIPNDKQVAISLTYLYGVGPRVSREACVKTSIDPLKPARDLDEDELSRLSTLLERDYTVEGPLRRLVSQNVNRLREIKCYRGLRHRMSLPVRGQRTRTNARTRKGPRKTVAGKKGVKDLR